VLVGFAADTDTYIIGKPRASAQWLREKFVDLEFHLLEQLARVVFVYRRTFFLRYAEIAARHDYLRRTLKAYDREYAQRRHKLFFAFFDDLASHAVVDMLGNRIHRAAAVARIAFFHYLYAQTDRIHDLNDRDGKIRVSCFAEIRHETEIVRCGIRLEYIHVALASEQDHVFVEYRDPFDFLGFAVAYAGLKNQFKEKSYVDLKKSAVERNRFYAYVCPYDFGVFASDIRRFIQYFLRIIGQKYF